MDKLRVLAAVTSLALLAAACGDDGGGGGGAAGDTAAGPTIALRDTSLGKVLVDADGMTLYLFTRDTAGTSSCADACAATWPPVKADGALTAGEGLDRAKLSSIDRPDGSKQVAYAGKPLYRYAPDTAAGDTKGQGVNNVWYAVGADGEAITQSAAAPPAYSY